jgi:hypothetical protein
MACPLTVFADHGRDGSGEPLAIVLGPGNAGSNATAATSPQPSLRWPSSRRASGGGW